jgi:hypothetical protein
MNNEICVLGNGSSLLNTKLGILIDSFETVARINNYTITDYEDFVGSKTNIWFNGANQKLKVPEVIPAKTVVLIPPEILIRKGESIHQRIQKRTGQTEYELVTAKLLHQFEKDVQSTRLTTGTNAILWAVSCYRTVYIHGFDFFMTSKTHYNDSWLTRFLVEKGIVRKAQKHDVEAEMKYIQILIDSGRVIQLKDKS